MKYLFSIFIILNALAASFQADRTQILDNYGKIPLSFTINNGQYDPQVKLTTRGIGCNMFFTQDGTTFLLSREKEESAEKRLSKRSVVYQENPDENSESEIKIEYFGLNSKFFNTNPSPEEIKVYNIELGILS